MEKEKRFSEGFLGATFVVGIAAGAILAVAVYALSYPVFQSKEWAAWLQAIGSITAIVAAWRISKTERDDAKANARDAAKVELMLIEQDIYQLHRSLHAASFAAGTVAGAKPEDWVNTWVNSSLYKGKAALEETLSISAKIEWRLFLTAMPEKAGFIRKFLSGITFLKSQDLGSLTFYHQESERLRDLLATLETLLSREEFIRLSSGG